MTPHPPHFWHKQYQLVNGHEVRFTHRQAQILIALAAGPRTHAELRRLFFGPYYSRTIVPAYINYLNKCLADCGVKIGNARLGAYRLRTQTGAECSVKSVEDKEKTL